MTVSSKKNRIIFIDLMRAFAVLMMVQGHTVDALLGQEYRDFNDPVFSLWHFMRGMTAPIFLFTAGTVFTYLFRLVDEPFDKNPRVSKGIKRFLLLVGLGYLLRYPTPTIVDFSQVTPAQWQIFLAVDVLQLIGFGLFFVILFAFISEKIRLNDYIVFSAGSVIFFGLYPIFDKVNWLSIFPQALAGYFYNGTGSNFPLFPWAGYVVAGAVLGSYLAKNPLVFKSSKFSLVLAAVGISFLILTFIGDKVESAVYGKSFLWSTSPNLIMLRLGLVLILNSIVSLIAMKIEVIPRVIILVGRNTLSIYIVHLVILYGSAWNPGLNWFFAESLEAGITIGIALVMLVLMILMVYLINFLKIKNKQLVT